MSRTLGHNANSWRKLHQIPKGTCTWCRGPVPKGARSWCGESCVEEFLIRNSQAHARARVHARDRGVCAGCGVDTDAIRQELREIGERYREALRSRPAPMPSGGLPIADFLALPTASPNLDRAREIVAAWWARGVEVGIVSGVCLDRPPDAWLRLIPFGGGASHLWEMDHIVPVEHGGGGCGLDNLQTLCLRCHKAKTAEQARQRAAARAAEREAAEVAAGPAVTQLGLFGGGA